MKLAKHILLKFYKEAHDNTDRFIERITNIHNKFLFIITNNNRSCTMKIMIDNYSSLARALRCFTSRFSWLSLAFGVYHHLLRLLSVDLGSCRSRYILVALGSFRCLSPLPPPFYIYMFVKNYNGVGDAFTMGMLNRHFYQWE